MRGRGLIACLLVLASCAPAPRSAPQLVVLAVDGLDPDILTRLLSDARLPHLAELASVSGVVRVVSTPGAEPASAWASFATGTNPGAHGVFDLVAPDPATGRPAAATLRPRPSARWFGSLWREGAAYAPVRDGAPFWSRAGETGVRSRVLFVPGTFPPEPVPSGTLVAGTPLPDWSGGWGTGYTWLASDVAPDQAGFTRYGGRVERLAFTRNLAHATLVGIRAPHRIDVPFTVVWNPEARSANITIGDETVHLNEGQQSRWLAIGVRLNLVRRVQGLVRVHLVKAGNDVQIYVSPIQWHPVLPPSAIASPPGEAPTLFARLGPFRTLAWPEAAWAVADGRLPMDAFDAAQAETFADRAAALLSQAEAGDWDLLVAAIETLGATTRMRGRRADAPMAFTEVEGRVQASDAVGNAYLQLDGLVGDLRARLPSDAGLVLVSPHALARTTRVVDLNRWLTDRGWLVWRTPPAPVTLAALADPALWEDTVDGTRTTARAMGSGHIYLNLRGRGPTGRLERGAGYDGVVADIRTGLETLTDPLSGRHVVAGVRTASEAYSGAHLSDAPDLVVTWAPGYRGSWDSLLGGLAPAVVFANDEPWLAEHAGLDEGRIPGAWLSTLPLAADTMSVRDVGPTVLQYFGLPAPADAGRPQLRARPSSTSRR